MKWFRFGLSNVLLSLLVFFCIEVPVIASSSKENPRIEAVYKLLYNSSAAEQIIKSNNAAAKNKYADAKQLYEQAVSQNGAGQIDESLSNLNKATRTMIEATRMADKKGFTMNKEQRDYDNRVESVDALMQAFDNITSEKETANADIDRLHAFVDERMKNASVLQSKGDLQQARKLVDEAYVAAKVAIDNLRGGETLVRALNFKNDEEEYLYEVDRNDTHTMLIQLLLKDKIRDGSMNDRTRQYLDYARLLRSDADKLAKGGDYKSAISVMEKSTGEIVRAIRSAGIYIPG